MKTKIIIVPEEELMEAEQRVMDSIRIQYESFYEQEKKIANYVLSHPEEVVNMTINELAKACTTSVATVTRFCKKVSSDGFHHLKIRLAREIAQQAPVLSVSDDVSADNIEQSLQNILHNKIEELQQTIAYLDPEMIKILLEDIEKANVIQFVAVGNTIPAALDGAFKFSSIGLKAIAGTIWETQLAFSLTLQKGDVLIAISNSGESRQVVKMVEQATARGVVTVAITNNPNSTLAGSACYHILTATREKLFLNEFYFSRISAMTVIEILYLLLAVESDTSYSSISHFESLIADEKM